MLCSCDWLASLGGHNDDYGFPVYMNNYNVSLNFKNSTGEDLIKGIGLDNWQGTSEAEAISGDVKNEEYSLNINIQYSPNKFPESHDIGSSTLSMQQDKAGDCWLINKCRTIYGLSKGVVLATYKLVLPHVFGDKKEHKITVYWEFPFKENNTANKYEEIERWSKCTKVLFDEHEVTFKTSQTSEYNTLISIIL